MPDDDSNDGREQPLLKLGELTWLPQMMDMMEPSHCHFSVSEAGLPPGAGENAPEEKLWEDSTGAGDAGNAGNFNGDSINHEEMEERGRQSGYAAQRILSAGYLEKSGISIEPYIGKINGSKLKNPLFVEGYFKIPVINGIGKQLLEEERAERRYRGLWKCKSKEFTMVCMLCYKDRAANLDKATAVAPDWGT